MKVSEQGIPNLAAALTKAQGELRAIQKDSKNPHFKNSYASLDAILETVRPTLAKHGLALVQGATAPSYDEAGRVTAIVVETMLVHASGEHLTNGCVIPIAKVDPQGAGGAMTYGRRYGVSALLALATDEDDDGNVASARPVAPAGRPTAQSAPAQAAGSVPPAIAEAAAALDAGSEAEPVCPKCTGPMWDNRVGKKNPKAPDFKCRDKSCEGVVWPPKGAKPAAPPAPQPVAAGEFVDDLPF
jgi:hypothetical protein